MAASLDRVVGAKLLSLGLRDNQLLLTFYNGQVLTVCDARQSCCENRFLHTDDDLEYYSGATFLGMEHRKVRSQEEEVLRILGGAQNAGGGDVIEIEFLIVRTSKGEFTVETHNEHNGFYGGFDVVGTFADGGGFRLNPE